MFRNLDLIWRLLFVFCFLVDAYRKYTPLSRWFYHFSRDQRTQKHKVARYSSWRVLLGFYRARLVPALHSKSDNALCSLHQRSILFTREIEHRLFRAREVLGFQCGENYKDWEPLREAGDQKWFSGLMKKLPDLSRSIFGFEVIIVGV